MRNASATSLALTGAVLLGGASVPQSKSEVSLQEHGEYRNPVLAGDYSDPDVIRVGDDFYLTASSFSNVPGLPILHSRDLVNWRLIGHALPRLSPNGHFATPRRGGGVWAPAWARRDGLFHIYYPDPDFGIFLVTARDPKGPWSAPALVDSTKGAIDPAPFFDDDGSAWLAHGYAASRSGFANVIILKKMNAKGTRTIDAGRRIIVGDQLPKTRTSIGLRPWQTTEGPKLYKRDGWYWIFVPSGSVKGGWQGVFRARSLYGPWEGRNVLDQGPTSINGPHQGAWVRTKKGEDWFLHFQDTDSYGRRLWLEPMTWRDGWPVIGVDPDRDGIGQPAVRHARPDLLPGQSGSPDEDDAFVDAQPSLAWQWNANPQDNWLAQGKKGALRLVSAATPVNLWEAGNVLSRKLPGERFGVITKLRFAPVRDGERAGMVMLGSDYAWIGVERRGGEIRLLQVVRKDASSPDNREVIAEGSSLASGQDLWLRMRAEPIIVHDPIPDFSPYWPSMLRSTHAKVSFAYSLDGSHFVQMGDQFVSRPGRWVGAQIGIFAQAPAGTPAFAATSVGFADFDWFRFEH